MDPRGEVRDNFLEVAKEVRARVANQLRGTPALLIQTDGSAASKDDQAAPTHRKLTLKTGRLCTADTVVAKRITEPHEVVYSSQGQSAIYNKMSAVLFVNGYLTVTGGRGSSHQGPHASAPPGTNGGCQSLRIEQCERLSCGLAPQ